MKNIFKSISAFSVALLAIGCTTDLGEQTVYDPANATAPVLDAIAESYELDINSPSEVAITFTWSEPDFGYSASATNNLVFDVEGKEFAGASTLTSINLGGTYAVTHETLNSAIMKLLDSYEMAYEATSLEFRVESSVSDSATPLYSNVVKSTITPYEGEIAYPFIYIVGDYNGWVFTSNQYLYSTNDDGIYTGFLAFGGAAANGWKITGEASWNNGNWGFENAADFTAEQSPVTLYDDGGSSDMKIYSKDYYNFTFDTNTLELTVNASYETWGVVGQFSDWSDDGDIPFTLATETSASGEVEYYLTATVDLVAGEGWKIRPDYSWGNDMGPGAFAGGEPSGADGNFYVEESGQYAIRWFFNKVEQRLEAVKLKSSTPAVVNALDASYTLTEQNAEQTALTLSWSAADLSTTESVTNQIEMDVVGKDFATAYVLGTTEDNDYTMTQLDLNTAITNLLNGYEMDIIECELEFRVYSSSSDSASVPTYSNSVSTKVTPYIKVLAGDDAATDEGYTGPDNSAYASMILVGDYNGWSFDQYQSLYSADNDNTYSGMVYLDGKGANGWKIAPLPSWDLSYGLASDGDSAEAELCLLSSDNGANIDLYSNNSYYFTFNSETLELTMSKPYSSWGIVGAYNSWGDSADTEMTLAARDNVYYLTATIEFTAGSEWKIRPDSKWGNDLGCSAVTVDSAYTTEGGNFTIPEDGIYTIRWYFNSVTQEVRVIKHAE